MEEKILSYLEKNERAVIIGNINTMEVTYCNLKATILYGITLDHFDLEKIFINHHYTLGNLVAEQLATKDSFFAFNILTTRKDGTQKNSNVQIGILDRELGVLYLEVTEKIHDELEILRSIIANSSKPMFIFDNNEQLTVMRANELFYKAFGTTERSFYRGYENSFSCFLSAQNQGDIFVELYKNIQFQEEYSFDVRYKMETGETKWFRVDVQKQLFGREGMKLVGFLIPIDQQKALMEQLQMINRQFDLVQKVTQEALYFIDLKTKIIVHRGKFAEQIGANDMEADYPECIASRVHPEEQMVYKKHTEKLLNGQDSSCSIRIKVCTGAYEWFQADASVLFNEDGEQIQIIGTMKNINKQREALKRELEQKTKNSTLTQVLDHFELKETTNLILNDSTQYNYHGFFFLELEDLTFLDKEYGEHFSDFVLEELGSRLAGNIRVGDLVGRVGENEFVLFLRNVPSSDVLITKANSMLTVLRKPVFDGKNQYSVQSSIGISTFPDHGSHFEKLYSNANHAIARTKHLGKNIATIYMLD